MLHGLGRDVPKELLIKSGQVPAANHPLPALQSSSGMGISAELPQGLLPHGASAEDLTEKQEQCDQWDVRGKLGQRTF